MTLAEGLAAYYAAFPQLKRGASLSKEAQDFFIAHDIVHVVYGCGISMPHEAIVKLSSFLATSEGLAVMRGYRLHESQDIYRTLSTRGILHTLMLSLILVPRTFWRSWRQTERWPWRPSQGLMRMKLADLRARYGIRVAGPLGA